MPEPAVALDQPDLARESFSRAEGCERDRLAVRAAEGLSVWIADDRVLLTVVLGAGRYRRAAECKDAVQLIQLLAAEAPAVWNAEEITRLRSELADYLTCVEDRAAGRRGLRTFDNLLAMAAEDRAALRRGSSAAVWLLPTLAYDAPGMLLPAPAPPVWTELQRAHADVITIWPRDARAVGRRDVSAVMEEVERVYTRSLRIVELAALGYAADAIARQVGIPARSAADCLEGRIPAALQNRTSGERRKRLKFHPLPRGCSEEFAYLLGAYAAAATPGQALSHLGFGDKSRPVIERIAGAVEAVFGEAPRIEFSARGSNYKVRFLSVGVARAVHELTQANHRVPWEHLVTREERAAFLRGVFDKASSIVARKSGCIDFTKNNGADLVRDLARLLDSFDIVPTVDVSRRATLRISPHADWLRFRELVGFTDPGMRDKLEGLCRLRLSRGSGSIEEYEAVRAAAALLPDMRAIARHTGVSYERVRAWVARGAKPDVIVRRERLQELCAGMPDPDVIGRAYRDFGLPSEAARALASEFRLRDLSEQSECFAALAALRQPVPAALEFLAGLRASPREPALIVPAAHMLPPPEEISPPAAAEAAAQPPEPRTQTASASHTNRPSPQPTRLMAPHPARIRVRGAEVSLTLTLTPEQEAALPTSPALSAFADPTALARHLGAAAPASQLLDRRAFSEQWQAALAAAGIAKEPRFLGRVPWLLCQVLGGRQIRETHLAVSLTVVNTTGKILHTARGGEHPAVSRLRALFLAAEAALESGGSAVPDHRREALLEKARKQLHGLERAAELVLRGYPAAAAAKEAGLPAVELSSFLYKGWLPAAVRRLAPPPIPRIEDPARAYLLGVLIAANVKPLRRTRAFVIAHTSHAAQQSFLAALEQVAPAARPVLLEGQGRRAAAALTRFIAPAGLRAEYAMVSSRGRQIPWACLGSRAEREQFVKGYLATRGQADLNLTQLRVVSLKGRDFVVELALLLSQIGITPTVSSRGLPLLRVLDRTSFELLLRGDLLENPRHRTLAEKAVAGRTHRVSLPAELYERVLAYRQAHPDESQRSIAKRFELPISTTRAWLSGEQAPSEVARQRKLEALARARRMQNYPAIAELVREHGIEPAAARLIAQSFNPSSAATLVESARALGWEPTTDGLQLLVLRQKLETLLAALRADQAAEPQAAEAPALSAAEEDELGRRKALIDLAAEYGIDEDQYELALAGLARCVAAKFDPFAWRTYHRFHLQQRGLDVEEVKALVYLHTHEALSRFDPRHERADLAAWTARFLKPEVYRRLSRLTGYDPQAKKWLRMLGADALQLGPSDIMDRLGVTRKRAQHIWETLHRKRESLDEPFTTQGEEPRGSFYEQRREEQPDQLAMQRDFIEKLAERLGPRQREVLYLRFHEGLTLEEAGLRLDLSRERVRQIEEQVMEVGRGLGRVSAAKGADRH